MAMMEFKDDQGQTLRLDGNLTLAQLTARGIRVQLHSKDTPDVPGAFYPTDEALNSTLIARNLIPDGSGVALVPSVEYCWRCGGHGKTMCHQTPERPDGYEPCIHCKGTGYGESLQTYRKRIGA